jgi:hypothetical protein
VEDICKRGNEPLGSIKSSVTAQVAISQEGLNSMESANYS